MLKIIFCIDVFLILSILLNTSDIPQEKFVSQNVLVKVQGDNIHEMRRERYEKKHYRYVYGHITYLFLE